MTHRLVIAGGGTGGHLYPGIAVAEALKAIDASSSVLFVGTERGIEARAVPKAGFEVKFIQIGGLKRVGMMTRAKTLVDLPRSVLTSRSILKGFGATAVLGVGGYASGPVLTAARLMGLPTAICEQNSVPGFTNKILGKMVRRVYGAFPAAASFFSAAKFALVGNPVRASFLEAIAQANIDPTPGRVFVFGGSQGARPLNERVPAAIAELKARGVEVDVVHQTGKAERVLVEDRYREAGVEGARVLAFIDDMVREYREAQVVVCRAGATSCAELTVLGVPSILVPFPAATDDHQTKNARDLEAPGAAILMPQSQLDTNSLADVLESLMSDDDQLRNMRAAAASLGRPDAAEVIARAAMNAFAEAA